MKKTKINLLTTREDYGRIERFFQLVRRVTVLYSALLLGFVVIIFMLIFLTNRKLQTLIETKNNLLFALNGQKDNEAKLIYVAKKMDAYDQFIVDDARFLPYYNHFVKALTTSTASATISSFAIEKDRTIAFTLVFRDFESMIDSFKFIESEEFLKNFENLLLQQFTSQGQEATTYRLTFKGKFIRLNEN